jgi:hypothetical protein
LRPGHDGAIMPSLAHPSKRGAVSVAFVGAD